MLPGKDKRESSLPQQKNGEKRTIIKFSEAAYAGLHLGLWVVPSSGPMPHHHAMIAENAAAPLIS
jgi:hypothetical protein